MRSIRFPAMPRALAAAGLLLVSGHALAHVCAPSPRASYTAAWTGTELIVWGGVTDDTTALASGARYDPATDRWTTISTAGAPAARFLHSAVWTGREMIVWGGANKDGVFGNGARYDPATDTWSALTATGAPPARYLHSAVWT